jgi:hypothetical protein
MCGTWKVVFLLSITLTLHDVIKTDIVMNFFNCNLNFWFFGCLFFCPFSFGHCVVCSSSIYGLWLPLWYPQTLLPPWSHALYNVITGGELRCFGRVSSSCPTSGTRRVNIVSYKPDDKSWMRKNRDPAQYSVFVLKMRLIINWWGKKSNWVLFWQNDVLTCISPRFAVA